MVTFVCITPSSIYSIPPWIFHSIQSVKIVYRLVSKKRVRPIFGLPDRHAFVLRKDGCIMRDGRSVIVSTLARAKSILRKLSNTFLNLSILNCIIWLYKFYLQFFDFSLLYPILFFRIWYWFTNDKHLQLNFLTNSITPNTFLNSKYEINLFNNTKEKVLLDWKP